MSNKLAQSIAKEEFIELYTKALIMAKVATLHTIHNSELNTEAFKLEVALALNNPSNQDDIEAVHNRLNMLPGYDEFLEAISAPQSTSYEARGLDCLKIDITYSNEHIEECFELIRENHLIFIDDYFNQYH